jgi:hypothetical protein
LIFMALTLNPPTALHTHFFGPLLILFPKLKTFRSCPKVSDSDWLQLGICRALEGIRSGRDFLQTLQAKLRVPTVARFFLILQSKRRLAFCAEANAALCATLTDTVPDAFAAYACLADFDLHAADGHSHKAAVHDLPQPSKTSETGYAKTTAGAVMRRRWRGRRVRGVVW